MLRDIINDNSKNLTTLLTLYVLVNEYIDSLEVGNEPEGLSMTEITRKYDALADIYHVREKFYASYIQRHSGESGLYLEQEGKYRIKDSLVDQYTLDHLKEITDLFDIILRGRNEIYTEFFNELDEMLVGKNADELKSYIINRFEEKRLRNFGQIYEVLAYSILKIYFYSFGFSLKRFSVSFSADGGMDYIASNGIYQVTASPSQKKITGDLEKLPDTLRVMVLTNCSDTIRNLCLDAENVLEVITADDLKNHFLEWMYQRDLFRPGLLLKVVGTIRDEMLRETK